MFEVYGLGLAAAGQWGLAKLPCLKHAVTVMSPQLRTETKTKTTSVKIIFLGLTIPLPKVILLKKKNWRMFL